MVNTFLSEQSHLKMTSYLDWASAWIVDISDVVVYSSCHFWAALAAVAL
jgi:hypothetical protein